MSRKQEEFLSENKGGAENKIDITTFYNHFYKLVSFIDLNH